MSIDVVRVAQALVDRIKSAVAPIESRVDGLTERITALEGIKALVPRDGRDGEKGEPGESGPVGDAGPQGEPGPPGEKGDAGARGEIGPQGDAGPVGPAGEQGPQGDAGSQGEPGVPGQPGAKGDTGERGPEGPEGKPGRDGRDGLAGVQGEKGLDGTTGRDGVDGKDGLGFDDLQVDFDGERTFMLRAVSGERVKELGRFRTPTAIYRGVYQAGKTYDADDLVTWAGSVWHATGSTDAKPGAGATPWRLAVKAGRDGKDGRDGKEGLKGADGRPGRDLVQPWKS